jgi:hypothetical protein
VNAEVLKFFYGDRPAPAPWARPTGLIERRVDRTTGMLATAWCPPEAVYTEVYIPETEPREPCDIHGPWGTREWADSLGAIPDSLAPPVSDDFEF